MHFCTANTQRWHSATISEADVEKKPTPLEVVVKHVESTCRVPEKFPQDQTELYIRPSHFAQSYGRELEWFTVQFINQSLQLNRKNEDTYVLSVFKFSATSSELPGNHVL